MITKVTMVVEIKDLYLRPELSIFLKDRVAVRNMVHNSWGATLLEYEINERPETS